MYGRKEDLQRKRGSDESSDELIIYKIVLREVTHICWKDISLTSPSESKQDPAEPTRYKNPAMSPIFLFYFILFFVETTFSLLGLPWGPTSRFKQLLIREVREWEIKEKTIKKQ